MTPDDEEGKGSFEFNTTPTTSSLSATTSACTKEVKICTEPKEELFDEDGNVTQVANLHFIQGILGHGAFGTVRLARRKIPKDEINNHRGGRVTPLGTGPPAAPSSSNSPHFPFKDLKARRNRRHHYQKSQSAPVSSDFFAAITSDEENELDNGRLPSLANEEEEQERQQQQEQHQHHGGRRLPLRRLRRGRHGEEGDSDGRHRSPSVVGNLGLFIRSRVSFEDQDDDEELVAVKIFSKSILKRQRTLMRDKKSRRVKVKTALQQVEREIALMKKLSHPNLVNLFEVIDSPESDMLYMVLEYMPLGEILSYQNDGTFRRKDPRAGCTRYQIPGIVNGHFDEDQAALYFVDILHGLGYLHQHHICHRDLKPENILLDARGIAKVADFGVSHIFDKEPDFGVHRQASLDNDLSDDDMSMGEGFEEELGSGTPKRATHPDEHPPNILTRMDTDAALAMKGMAHYGMLSRTEGTWCFWSPEMCSGSQAFSGYAADMWAAGVCLYIFVTGLLPFYSEIPTELFEKIEAAEISYDGLGLSESMIDLLKRCLEKDPDKRAGVGDCLQHPLLQPARAMRIKQLSAEFEDARERKIVLSEEDIKAAFRIVVSVPERIIKSAGKTFQSGAKRLQEGFAEARERLSMGISSASQSSSLNDSLTNMEQQANGSGSHGGVDSNSNLNSSHNDSGGHHGFFRGRLGTGTSSTHSGGRKLFGHKSSYESHSSNEGRPASETQEISPAAAGVGLVEPPGGGEVAINRMNRMPSALSSNGSFGSTAGVDDSPDLPMILSEEDEHNDEDETERTEAATIDDEPISSKKEAFPLKKNGEGNPETAQVSPEKAPSVGQPNHNTSSYSPELAKVVGDDKSQKRRKRSKEKCVIQ